MKAIRKRIIIEAEFSDRAEIKKMLQDIIFQIDGGVKQNRKCIGTGVVEFKTSLANLGDYREEKINGQWCMVYESRMNSPRSKKASDYEKK